MRFEPKNKILIAGHRGNPKDCPENTMPSFRSAIDAGVDMIETDIHATKDGVLVLIHDNDTARVTGTCGKINEMTYEEVKKLRVGDPEKNITIPTLDEFLKLCSPHENLTMDLEIKVYSHEEGMDAVKYTVENTVRMLEENKIDDDRVLFNCFDAYVLEYIYKKYNKRFRLHGYYPYTAMHNVDKCEDMPEAFLDYACIWGKEIDVKACCGYLLSHGIEPCDYLISNGKSMAIGADGNMMEYLSCAGCSLFTMNDPAPAVRWRNDYEKKMNK